MLDLAQALEVTEELIRRVAGAGIDLAEPIVLVGGTALAAHGIRQLSEDVDLFIRDFAGSDVAFSLERELRAKLGPTFKLDITGTENLWGAIIVRDIAEDSAGAVVRTVEVAGRRYRILALSPETSFVLKVAAGRTKDLGDLPLLAQATNARALVNRFNTLIHWHGDRNALAGFADAFVDHLVHLYREDALALIGQLNVPEYIKDMLCEVRALTR